MLCYLKITCVVLFAFFYTNALPISKKSSAAYESITKSKQPSLSDSRSISYDQRQEGTYNVRANLENFVVLVIPSTQSASLSLLDMLMTKSNLKRQNLKLLNMKRLKNKTNKIQQLNAKRNENSYPVPSREHFIEGRTPYHVDISSMELLPPIGQLEFPNSQEVMKSHSEGNQPNAEAHKRIGKAIVDSNPDALLSNSVIVVAKQYNGARKQTTSEWDDLGDTENAFDSLNVDNIDRLAGDGRTGINGNDGDGWELSLLGATEQCGPDRVRDSYGVCQFVSPDFL